MLTYNTHLKDLTMPEYGRIVQSMVDRCMAIEDRAERNACAAAIVRTMGVLFPDSRNDDESLTFWNHLAVMSDFKLDIDWPEGVTLDAATSEHPEPVPYDTCNFRSRTYGARTEFMLQTAAEMEPSDERTALITLIANQMKKTLLAINKDDDPDQRIFHDMYELTGGRIRIDSSTIPLHDYNVIVPAGKKKKKK